MMIFGSITSRNAESNFPWQGAKNKLIFFFINQIQRAYEDRPNPSGFLQGFAILVGNGFYRSAIGFFGNYLSGLNQLILYLQA